MCGCTCSWVNKKNFAGDGCGGGGLRQSLGGSVHGSMPIQNINTHVYKVEFYVDIFNETLNFPSGISSLTLNVNNAFSSSPEGNQ